MRVAASALACVALGGCAARIVVDPRPLAVLGTATPPVVAPPPEVAPPITTLGPLRKAGPILFTPSRVAATVTSQVRSLASWAGTVDGRARAEIGCKRGVQWRDAASTSDVAARADTVVVAPDGSELVLVSKGQLARHTIGDGRPSTASVLTGDQAVYAADHTLAVRRGCTWFASAADGSPIEIGDSCGALVQTEVSRPRWWFAEPADKPTPAGARPGFTIASALALSPDAAPMRVSFGDRLARAVAVSPDGQIVCGIFDERGHDVLDCRLSESGELERIANDVFGAPRFAEGARRMVFTIGDEDHVPRALELVDFQHKIVRRLGRIAHHRFDFLPGGDHVVAYDGARGLVFELETGFATPFGDADDDWVSLGAGDRPGTFLASRLRARCVELVRVELPPADAPR